MNSLQTATVLGLTSGSALDGINAAIIKTDGVDVFEFGQTFDIPYDDSLREALRHIQRHFTEMSEEEKQRIEKSFTDFHIAAAREIIIENPSVSLVGFGGHVVCHKPLEHILYQLGLLQNMADELNIKVVGKFRHADILAGGQGAPLAPVYHAALAQKIEKPLAFVDIGGLSALTFIGENGELIAFDTGPGNAALNDWVNKHGGMEMDYNGKLGITGHIHDDVLSSMMKHKFLSLLPPKAADNQTFNNKLEHLEGLNLEDGAATVTAYIAESITKAVRDFLPLCPTKIIVCGGGTKNPTLMRFLRQRLNDTEVVVADEYGFDAVNLEAQAFGFLAVRRLNHMPTSYPSTTGAVQEVIGGEIFEPCRCRV